MVRNIPRDKQLLTLGVLTGALIGSITVWQARKYQQNERKPGLIDWDRVRSVAISMNKESALSSAERLRLDAEYQRLVGQTIELVADYTGDTLPRNLDGIYAFDRVDWINANIESFERMFAPIEKLELVKRKESGNPLSNAWHSFNQSVLSAEAGLLLGYLAKRVLGQYDLALLGREPLTDESGKLYFVQPNIQNTERALQLPPDQFRLWLALHETTHAFEFESHPWLREYMNDLLEEYFTYLTDDMEYLRRGVEAVRMYWDRVRTSNGNSANSWIEMVMSPEQRRLFARMQAMMAVVEGYSNHVMNAVGEGLMPDYQLIHKRFETRQQRRSLVEQLFARLTGLDIKLAQYRIGEAFINTVVEREGHDFARRVWESPDTLPTMRELSHPGEWILRIEAELPPIEQIG